jgi:hypothetical protein
MGRKNHPDAPDIESQEKLPGASGIGEAREHRHTAGSPGLLHSRLTVIASIL